MAEHLDIAIPSDLETFAAALTAAGHDAVLVGGAVRDALLGTPGADYDLVTNATLDAVREIANAGGPDAASLARSVYTVGERFGTLGLVLAEGTHVEVSRYREAAFDGATVAQRFSADATKRDFTVNTMGIDLAASVGEASGAAPPMLLDPLGGREDLAVRLLRAPGIPAERFAEDPLRVLRLARFVSQLGFEAEPETLEAARSAAPTLAGVAIERVRDELTKLLLGRHPAQGLRVVLETEALAVVLPEVAAMDGVTQPTFHDLDVFAHTAQTVSLTPSTHALRWAALLHDVGKVPARSVEPDGRIRFFGHPKIGAQIAEEVCQRLRMSNAQAAAIVHLVREHMRLGNLHTDNRRAVDRAVRKLDLWERGSTSSRPLVSAEDAVSLTVADFGATAARERTSEVRSMLEGVVAASRERGTGARPKPALSGKRVMEELDVPEGPDVGAAIRAVDEAIAAGELKADDHHEAIEIARRAVEQHHGRKRRHGRARG